MCQFRSLQTVRTLVLFCLTLIVMTNTSSATDPQFSQFYANPLYLNPAFAGTARCPRVVMNYRDQWPGISAGPTFVTYSFSLDQHVDKLHGGIGLLVVNDKAADTWTTGNYSGMYSYQLNINRRLSLKAGFQGTYVQRSIDLSKLTFGEQIDPRYGFVYPTSENLNGGSASYFDFSTGALLYSRKLFLGFAAHHITQPTEKFIDSPGGTLPMKITAHAGTVIYIEEPNKSASSLGSYISPNILIQSQGPFSQVNMGMYYAYGPLVLGGWMRYSPPTFDSAILLVGIETGIFKFGYSYDFPVSSLKFSNSHGSHEVSFSMQFPCKPKKKRFRSISCPSF